MHDSHLTVFLMWIYARGDKEMSSILADIALSLSANEYSCAHGSQINFGEI